MADIAMCADTECPSRIHCYRYRARANELRQNYTDYRRHRNQKQCLEYWSVSGRDDQDLTPMKELEPEL